MIQVIVWVLNIETIRKKPEVKKEVTPAYLLKSDKMKFEKGKLQELAAGYLLYHYLGVHSDDKLCYNEYHKPMLADESKCFNISHSGQYVVLAASDVPVGVDVEEERGVNSYVVNQFFLPEDREEINRLLKQGEETDAGKLFQKCWTKFEAIIKLKGTGLAKELDQEEYHRIIQYVKSFDVGEYAVSLVVDGACNYQVIMVTD